MLALGWPMVLTNLAQEAMTATDVMIIGRQGAEQLPAGEVAARWGTNVYDAASGIMARVARVSINEAGD